MSWKPEVKVGGEWIRNGLVFASEEEARSSARIVASAWKLVTNYRAVEVTEPVNKQEERT